MGRLLGGLVVAWMTSGCGEPGAGERGRMVFEVDRGAVALRDQTVAVGTTVDVTLRAASEAQRPSEPVAARLSGLVGSVELDDGRVSSTEVRTLEVARLKVSFTGPGEGTLEVVGARSGVLLDRLPVRAAVVASLEPELAGDTSGETLDAAHDVLTLCASPVALRYHFAAAGGQRLYGTPALASACLGDDPSRCLPVAGDQVTLRWTPTLGETLGGGLVDAVTLGLANVSASGHLSVSDGTNSGTLALQLTSPCPP